MGFDGIYKLAIWVDSTAREYGVKVSTITKLFKAISQHHTEEETKQIIIDGFELGKGGRQ